MTVVSATQASRSSKSRCDSGISLCLFIVVPPCGDLFGPAALDQFALAEAIATFDQLSQSRTEASCRGTVDQTMIEAQRHAQVFADGDLPIDDPRFLNDAAQGNIKGMVVDRDTPAATFAKHPDCRYAHGPTVLLLHPWIRLTHPAEAPPADSEERGRQETQPMGSAEALPGSFYLLHLGRPDLVMKLSEGLLIRGSDDVDNGLLLASYVALDRGRHVALIKQAEVLATFATCLQGVVLIDRSRHTGGDERREREGLPRFRFVIPQERARPGHIDFEQAMDHGLAFDRRIHDLQRAPELRVRNDLTSIVFLVHQCSTYFHL